VDLEVRIDRIDSPFIAWAQSVGDRFSGKEEEACDLENSAHCPDTMCSVIQVRNFSRVAFGGALIRCRETIERSTGLW
jgi:hypothetical protein